MPRCSPSLRPTETIGLLEMERQRSPAEELLLCWPASLGGQQAAAQTSRAEGPAGDLGFSPVHRLSAIHILCSRCEVSGTILSFLHGGDCIVIANYTLQLLMVFNLIVL